MEAEALMQIEAEKKHSVRYQEVVRNQETGALDPAEFPVLRNIYLSKRSLSVPYPRLLRITISSTS